MNVVAIRTGNLVVVMGSTVPAKADVRVVATETCLVLHLYCSFFARTEFDNWRPFLATPYPRCVRSTRAVARLALQLSVPERGARVGGYAVFAAEDGQGLLIAVTGEAGIGALLAV